MSQGLLIAPRIMISSGKRILFYDLEVSGENTIYALGALFEERKPLNARNAQSVREVLPVLRNWIDSVDYVCGHNALKHDFPILEKTLIGQIPQGKKLDTLLLSPLAFPKKPYHALVKEGKLVTHAKNDPVADARVCEKVLQECLHEFSRANKGDLEIYSLGFLIAGLSGMAGLVASCGGYGGTSETKGNQESFKNESGRFLRLFKTLNKNRCCLESMPPIKDAGDCLILAYIHAWLNVSGSDSVLPYWLCHRFPSIRPWLHQIRSRNCVAADCTYCSKKHSPRNALKFYFGFESYRPVPSVPGDPEKSLQEHIVSKAMEGESLLAILPTGGGKSLCFQVPALHRYDCTGALTIVISPLQSLMKDQVGNLRSRAGILHCNALYGLLTPLERNACLEEIRLGSIGLLYVAPEQLRSAAFRNAIKHREIAFWVYDEAHCLSKWGHDFRTDYLYAATFIREIAEEQGVECPGILALTATAKEDVKSEIRKHFKDELGVDMILLDGGTDRENLSYIVEKVNSAEKLERIHEILTCYYGEQPPYDDHGSTVIFGATRKQVEDIAEKLKMRGWEVAAFHAGLDDDCKKSILEQFLQSKLKIIVSTNAFGMGVDKPDIRYVIHADAPGSLENYLQEAGRGGRDGQAAECILLYDESDLETQHKFVAYSKISQKDIGNIWRAIRTAKQDENGAIVLTVDEILSNNYGSNVSFDGDYGGGRSTKTKAAIAMLERQRFLERKENRSRVFQARSLVNDLGEAREKIVRLGLSIDQTKLWMAIMKVFFELPESQCADVRAFSELEEMQAEYTRLKEEDHRIKNINTVVFKTLNAMTQSSAGLLEKDLLFSAYLKSGNLRSAKSLAEVNQLEAEFLKLLQEWEPDANGHCDLFLLKVNEVLFRNSIVPHLDTLQLILKTLQADWLKIQNDSNGFEIRQLSHHKVTLLVRKSWSEIIRVSELRREMATVILTALTEMPAASRDGESRTLVSFSESELLGRLREDLSGSFSAIKDLSSALHHTLLWMHETKILELQQGKSLITTAMTLYLREHQKGSRARQFTKGDFAPLAFHYTEKILQVHIIGEYARKGIEEVGRHLDFIKEYFRLGGEKFINMFFYGKSEMLGMATGIGSYTKIYEDLKNAKQQAIVGASERRNLMVLAGPGSGKTRVIAHRCAWLLRVERVRPQSIVVLCYNRQAALQLRRRIWGLVDKDAAGVTIKTFHALALRVLGRTMADVGSESEKNALRFEDIIPEANRMLKSDSVPIGMDPDDIRRKLSGDLTHILVDEYQDIFPDAYEFVSLLAGKARESEDEKLNIMVVGDDDQSIFKFAGANVEFIRRFENDYAIKSRNKNQVPIKVDCFYLLENYRSTKNIIMVANRLISANRDRMKVDKPIEINESRSNHKPGGEWQRMDPLSKGLVQILRVSNCPAQAMACVEEIGRLKGVDSAIKWKQIAVFARNNDALTLIRLLLEQRDIPVSVLGENLMPNIRRARDVYRWLNYLNEHREQFWSGDRLLNELKSCLSHEEIEGPRGQLLSCIASEFYGETGGAEQYVADICEHYHGVLAEEKRAGIGEGVLLSTAHRAKGLEFDHVLVLDGEWMPRNESASNIEEERRLFYVAMTRARKTLALFKREDLTNQFISELKGEGVMERRVTGVINCPQPSGIICRRIELNELYLSFAANFRPNSSGCQALYQLKDGDLLNFHCNGNNRIELKDLNGRSVTSLSKLGRSNWGPVLDRVIKVVVTGVHIRKNSDGEKQAGKSMSFRDEWEIPIFSIYYRKE